MCMPTTHIPHVRLLHAHAYTWAAQAAYQQLTMALEALGPSPRSVAAAAATPTYSVAMEAQHQCMAARYHLLAAQAAWELGGEYR